MKIGRFIRSFRYGEKGFTLIELLVVIAILGILAAIIVPNFGRFFGQGQTQACQIEDRMVKTAAMAYVAENGACPADINALAPYFEGGVTDIMGTYSFTGTFPNCVVTQTKCPK